MTGATEDDDRNKRSNSSDPDVVDPDNQAQPDDGPNMTMAGAMPSGSNMDHWVTAMPTPDATKPETMPHTDSTPMPGESEDRDPV